MKRNALFSLCTALALVLVVGGIFLATRGVQAQEQDPRQPAPGAAAGPWGPQAAVGTAFTYQGRLTDGGSPANGAYDLEFKLYNAASGGTQVGSTITLADVTVSDGLFTVSLDFGAVFDGTALWLQIGVRPGDSSGTYTPLSPRQSLTAAPYAHSLRPGADVVGSLSGQGTLTAQNSASGSGSSALYGYASAASGYTYGVYGLSASTSGRGTYGGASATSGETTGVWGWSASTSGRGVYGHTSATTGFTYAVYGQSDSTTGRGVYGEATSTSGEAHGVFGRTYSEAGRGVYGYASATTGDNYGVYGWSRSNEGIGVYGRTDATSGETYGVYGVSESASDWSTGVFGVATAESGLSTYGVLGINQSTNGSGVFGYASASSGSNVGVYGRTNSPSGYAGYFYGDVQVVGDFSVSGSKAFVIDHPLDPANQYLYHYSVESSEVLNQYSGNVTLDDDGAAWVELPEWFEAINTDFRYQLTPIGAPMPGLYIAQEVRDNAFRIAGGEPGMRVSWQITALRNDPYIRQSPHPVEQAKPEGERGLYLHPELYGQPEEMGMGYHQRPPRMLEP